LLAATFVPVLVLCLLACRKRRSTLEFPPYSAGVAPDAQAGAHHNRVPGKPDCWQKGAECKRPQTHARFDPVEDRSDRMHRGQRWDVKARVRLAVELEQERARVGNLKIELEQVWRPW
jgi:hypothetical protein